MLVLAAGIGLREQSSLGRTAYFLSPERLFFRAVGKHTSSVHVEEEVLPRFQQCLLVCCLCGESGTLL